MEVDGVVTHLDQSKHCDFGGRERELGSSKFTLGLNVVRFNSVNLNEKFYRRYLVLIACNVYLVKVVVVGLTFLTSSSVRSVTLTN